MKDPRNIDGGVARYQKSTEKKAKPRPEFDQFGLPKKDIKDVPMRDAGLGESFYTYNQATGKTKGYENLPAMGKKQYEDYQKPGGNVGPGNRHEQIAYQDVERIGGGLNQFIKGIDLNKKVSDPALVAKHKKKAAEINANQKQLGEAMRKSQKKGGK